MVKRGLGWAFAAGLAILLTAVLLRLLGPLNAGLVRLRQDFRARPPVSLFDSLPALSPGLSGLEAFSINLPASAPTNPDRSLWISDSLDTLSFAFYTERNPFDSARLYLWFGDSVLSETSRRRGSFDWKVAAHRPVAAWSEVVGLYASHPPLFRVRPTDSSIVPFERVEGNVLHVLSSSYATLPENPRPPDTAYPASGPEDLTLLARGNTLAVANATRRAVRLRVLNTGRRSSTLHYIPAGTVHVYRGILGDGTTLAYTGAGEPVCFLGRCRISRREFFRLERP